MPAAHGHDDDFLYELQCPKELLPRTTEKKPANRRSRCKRIFRLLLKSWILKG